MAYGPKQKFWLIKTYGQMLRDRGIDPNKLSCIDIESALRSIGANFTDCEGNYWGHMFNSDGKQVRICIPVR